MKNLPILSLLVSTFLFASNCMADYTANHISNITWVKIYNSDVIYYGLETMPTDHQCSGTFFVLSPTLTEKQRDRYYSMLLTAKTTKAQINVGYDKVTADCYATRPVTHAISLH